MMLGRLGVIALVLCMLVAGGLAAGSALAQGDGEELLTFTAEDGSVTLTYPASWDVTVPEKGVVRIVSQDGATLTVEELSTEESDPETLFANWSETAGVGFGDVTPDTLPDGRVVVSGRVEMESVGDTLALLLVVVVLDDEALAVIDVTGPADALDAQADVIWAVVASVNRPADAGEGLPAQLETYAGDMASVIAELQEKGVIASGGERVFSWDYALLRLQWGTFAFQALPAGPSANFVMSGELLLALDSAGQDEQCRLMMRMQHEGSYIVDSLSVGLDREGAAYYREYAASEFTVDDAMSGVDLSEPHIFTVIVLVDTLSVYIDGQLIWDRVPVQAHSGTWGLGLTGETRSLTTCEIRDVWVFATGTPGLCEVTTSGTANRRSGPGTTFESPGQFTAGSTAQVIGQAVGSDGFTWWQMDDESWVRGDVVSVVGDCANVPPVTE